MNDSALETIRTQYGALNKRMKRVVWSGIVAIIYLVIDTAIIQPLMEEYSEVTKQIEQAKAETKLLGMGILKLENKTGISSNLSTDQQIQQFKEKIKQLDRKIETAASRFVDPEEMVKFVEHVLTETRGVKLVSLGKLPVERISRRIVDTPPVQKADTKAAIDKVVNNSSNSKYNIYRHGMRVSVKGRYGDLLRYLEKLETTPWQMSWNSAMLKTEEYPNSELSIVIHTLSLDETWLRI